MKKQFLFMLLALYMVLTLLPGIALASEIDGTEFLLPLSDKERLTLLEKYSNRKMLVEASEQIAEKSTNAEKTEPITKMRTQSGDLIYPVMGGNLYFDPVSGTIKDCDLSVTGADIPSNINGVAVTSIGDGAFWDCSSLTSVTIPENVTSIGNRAFQSCSSLKSVTIPEGVTSIENLMFFDCNSLMSVTIPGSVTSIGNSAFKNCSSLTSVIIPENVTSLGTDAFFNCSSLKSATILGSLTIIGEGVFSGCGSLEGVTIPGSVTSIEHRAFWGCSSLESVTIPEGVTSIGEGAFKLCSSLESVTIPKSVTSIGTMAFDDCSGLMNVTILGSITSIEPWTFLNCSRLTNITIPESVTSIEWGAFYNCSDMTTVTIPESVTSIRGPAFSSCTSLTDIYYGGTEAQWSAVSIDADNDSLASATIHFYQESGGDTPLPTEITDMSPNSKFTDVPATSPFAEAIDWAVNHGITNGKTPTTFAPNEQCTHAQILTFLWRCYGEPEPSIYNPFTNVSSDQYYYQAALWAYENGLISGNSFDGSKPCNRASVVSYMWKAVGSPEVFLDDIPNFTDVPSSASYAQAINWAISNGITTGTTSTTFDPARICTRGQIVTFLYRGKI